MAGRQPSESTWVWHLEVSALVLGAGSHSARLGLGAVRECGNRQGEESQNPGSSPRSSLYHCVTLGRSLKLPDLHSPSLWNGGHSGFARLTGSLRESDGKMNVNVLCKP